VNTALQRSSEVPTTAAGTVTDRPAPAVPRAEPARIAPQKATPAPLPSVRVLKINVHKRQGTGRFSRAAGYNGDFDLQAPGAGSTPLHIDEFLEVRRNGQDVLREFVRSAPHRPGRFESKQRVPALKRLDPGMYEVRLVLVADGRTLGFHDWNLEVAD
jgi:hypothetical protein